MSILTKITCPYCGDEPEVDHIWTNPEWHEEECDECGEQFAYKLIEFDWETWDDEYIGQPEKQSGNSKTKMPPPELDYYKIPHYKCEVTK